MCGRYEGENTETWKELHEIFNNFIPPPVQPDLFGKEIRPTNSYPVLLRGKAGDYKAIEARWWLIPSFFKGPIKEWKATTFNAKIEEAAEKPTFRGPWKTKHCLVPVSSFWEWSGEHPDDPKKKQRHCIRRADNQPMVLAGLWDYAVTEDGPVTSFTVLTRAAGGDMASLHTREPVLLDRDQWKPWVDCEPMPELAIPGAAGKLRPVPETRAYA